MLLNAHRGACSRSQLLLSLVVLVFASSAPGIVACGQGEAACFCVKAGGKWLDSPSTIRPTCRKAISYGGIQRTVDIYFPTGIQAIGKRYTPWLHLHGVHAAEWYIADNPQWRQLSKTWPVPLAGNAQVADMAVLTGSSVATGSSSSNSNSSSNAKGAGLLKDDSSILVVPQATGTVDKGQMWNALFWPCVAAISKCIDPKVDDIGFITYIITNMQQLLKGVSLHSKSYLSGYSNGGMLIQALLCKQPSITEKLSGIAIIASAVSSSFASSSECKGKLPRSLPLLWVHGTDDTTLLYGPGNSEGIRMLGVEPAVQFWATHMGCSSATVSNPTTMYADVSTAMVCKNYCQQQQPPVVLCTITGGTHFLWRMPSIGYTAGLIRWAMKGFKQRPVPF